MITNFALSLFASRCDSKEATHCPQCHKPRTARKLVKYQGLEDYVQRLYSSPGGQ